MGHRFRAHTTQFSRKWIHSCQGLGAQTRPVVLGFSHSLNLPAHSFLVEHVKVMVGEAYACVLWRHIFCFVSLEVEPQAACEKFCNPGNATLESQHVGKMVSRPRVPGHESSHCSSDVP